MALVRDHDSQFIDAFDDVFRTERLSSSKPLSARRIANTFAERWIGTLRRELLDWTIIWNKRELERFVIEQTKHYKNHRPRRSLDSNHPDQPYRQTIQPRPPQLRVIRTSRCNGLINEYQKQPDQPRHNIVNPRAAPSCQTKQIAGSRLAASPLAR